MSISAYRRHVLTGLIFLFYFWCSPPPVSGEYIFTKDGSIIEGAIITDGRNSLTVRTLDKSLKKISREEIIRVLYTKFNMSKIYIQKRDGKGFVAYVVDEDQDSYTFRTELYIPDEFVLKRSEILFISEKNPSGLQVDGEVEIDSAKLVWHPPYDPVKIYNIYIKKNERDKYELTERTKDKSIILKNLSSNTTYYIIVTGVDRDDYESSSSNELKIRTKNIPPSVPVIVTSVDNASGDKKLTWNASVDSDGKIEKYRVYAKKNGKREMIAEVKKTEYIFKKASAYEEIEVLAVDDMGDESGSARGGFANTARKTSVGFSPGIILPMGKFDNMADIAYGSMLVFNIRDFLINGFETGLSAGVYFSSGKDLSGENKPVYNSFMILPVLLNTGYRVRFGESFSILPSVSFGVSYIGISYETIEPGTSKIIDKSRSTTDPTVVAGLGGEYRLSELLAVSVSSGYGMFLEKDGAMPFSIATLAITYMF